MHGKFLSLSLYDTFSLKLPSHSIVRVDTTELFQIKKLIILSLIFSLSLSPPPLSLTHTQIQKIKKGKENHSN